MGLQSRVAESNTTEQLNNNNPYPKVPAWQEGVFEMAQPISPAPHPPPSLSGWCVGFHTPTSSHFAVTG